MKALAGYFLEALDLLMQDVHFKSPAQFKLMGKAERNASRRPGRRCDCDSNSRRHAQMETSRHYAQANLETKRVPERADPKLRAAK